MPEAACAFADGGIATTMMINEAREAKSARGFVIVTPFWGDSLRRMNVSIVDMVRERRKI
jgi:hypothetical protein